jgi:hypothetical protein
MRPGVKFGDVPMEDTLLKVLLDPDLDPLGSVVRGQESSSGMWPWKYGRQSKKVKKAVLWIWIMIR